MNYPPVAFHFVVSFDFSDAETAFAEVSGIESSLETITFKEGGENRFHHVLPVRTKHPNLILRRGLLTDSEVEAWCRDAIENLSINPVSVQVALLNENREPLTAFSFMNVWPVKWSISNLDAEKNAIVIETLELAYQSFKRI